LLDYKDNPPASPISPQIHHAVKTVCPLSDILIEKAEKIAEREGLSVFNIPELLLVCKEKGLIDKEEIKQIIEELKDKDRYHFKKEVGEVLLR